MKVVLSVGGNRGRDDLRSGEGGSVPFGVTDTQPIPAVQIRQLDRKYSGLHCIQAGIGANDRMPVFRRAAVVAQHAQALHPLGIVAGDGSGVPVSAQVFAGIETETGQPAGGAYRSSVAADAVRLSGIFDQFQPVPGAEFFQFGQVHGVAIQVHGDDGAGLFGDSAFDAGDVEMKSLGADIGKYGHGADIADGFRGGKKAVGGHDDFIARSDVGRLQGKFEGRGPGADSNRVFGAGKAGKLGFEFFDVFSTHKVPGIQHPADGVQYFFFNGVVLHLEIDKRNFELYGSWSHDVLSEDF